MCQPDCPMAKDHFILYHFPWLSAATLRYAEATLLRGIHLVPPVLDLGCGDGAFAGFAFDRQLDIGLDLTITRSPYLSTSYRAVVQASITDIPLEDSSVGTAISNSVMEHVGNLDQGLREICRVLKPGGEFALTVPSACSKEMSFAARLPLPIRDQRRWVDWYNSRLHIVYFMTPPHWEEILAGSGFDIVESRTYVQRPTMFWHTLFASGVLLGMQLLPQVRDRNIRQQNTRTGNHNTIGLGIGRLWFWMLGKGYTAPVADPSQGGYSYIRCRKR